MGSISLSNSLPITRLPLLTSLNQCLVPTCTSFSLPPLSNRRRSTFSPLIAASAVFAAPAGVNNSVPVSESCLFISKLKPFLVWWCETCLVGFSHEMGVIQLGILWQGDSICMLLSPRPRLMMVIMQKDENNFPLNNLVSNLYHLFGLSINPWIFNSVGTSGWEESHGIACNWWWLESGIYFLFCHCVPFKHFWATNSWLTFVINSYPKPLTIQLQKLIRIWFI